MLPVEDALEIVLAHTPRLAAEEVELGGYALGRVLAEEVRADADMPPFDRSAMDGYAVRAVDVADAPVVLEVAGQIRAGQYPDRPLPPRQAVQVMTGAPVPAGATAVQPVEKTRARDGGARVEILEAVATGAHIARRGCEVAAGDVVLEAGRAIDPATIAVLAAVGKARVKVGRRPDGRRPRHRRRAGGRVGHAGPRPHPQQQRLRGDGAGAAARAPTCGRWASSPTRPTASRTPCGRASRRTCW